MNNYKILAYVFIGIIFVSFANAAIIHGTTYDLSLRKLNNVRVEINTTPKQQIITQNGTYFFDVENGDYTIKAELMQKSRVLASAQENISVRQDGSYVLDMILFPDVEEGLENVDIDVNGDIVGTKSNNWNAVLIILIVLIIISAIATVFHFNKIKDTGKKAAVEQADQKILESQDTDLEQVIKLIKNEDGRATQKEIRKNIPLSEAKISLMIAELEHKGIVEKIKKGRGNIIILKK